MKQEHEILFPQFTPPEGIVESMNNFHGHMPGGIYRPAEEPGQGFLRKAMKEHLETFASFIDLQEEDWPQDVDRELAKAVKTKRDIQRDLDEVLKTNPQLAEKWDQNKTNFRGGGSISLRELVLRPIYSLLREKYSEQDLSS